MGSGILPSVWPNPSYCLQLGIWKIPPSTTLPCKSINNTSLKKKKQISSLCFTKNYIIKNYYFPKKYFMVPSLTPFWNDCSIHRMLRAVPTTPSPVTCDGGHAHKRMSTLLSRFSVFFVNDVFHNKRAFNIKKIFLNWNHLFCYEPRKETSKPQLSTQSTNTPFVIYHAEQRLTWDTIKVCVCWCGQAW